MELMIDFSILLDRFLEHRRANNVNDEPSSVKWDWFISHGQVRIKESATNALWVKLSHIYDQSTGKRIKNPMSIWIEVDSQGNHLLERIWINQREHYNDGNDWFYSITKNGVEFPGFRWYRRNGCFIKSDKIIVSKHILGNMLRDPSGNRINEYSDPRCLGAIFNPGTEPKIHSPANCPCKRTAGCFSRKMKKDRMSCDDISKSVTLSKEKASNVVIPATPQPMLVKADPPIPPKRTISLYTNPRPQGEYSRHEYDVVSSAKETPAIKPNIIPRKIPSPRSGHLSELIKVRNGFHIVHLDTPTEVDLHVSKNVNIKPNVNNSLDRVVDIVSDMGSLCSTDIPSVSTQDLTGMINEKTVSTHSELLSPKKSGISNHVENKSAYDKHMKKTPLTKPPVRQTTAIKKIPTNAIPNSQTEVNIKNSRVFNDRLKSLISEANEELALLDSQYMAMSSVSGDPVYISMEDNLDLDSDTHMSISPLITPVEKNILKDNGDVSLKDNHYFDSGMKKMSRATSGSFMTLVEARCEGPIPFSKSRVSRHADNKTVSKIKFKK